MSSVHQFVQLARALAAAPSACVLATLVDVTGSSFRRPGARLLIQADGQVTGGISAGCLEDELCTKSFEWTRHGDCVKEFHLGSNEDDVFGWGSGCKGTLSVLLQRVEPSDALIAETLRAIEAREAGIMGTIWSHSPRRDTPHGLHFLLVHDAAHSDVAPQLLEMLEGEAQRCRRDGITRNVQYSTAAGEFSVLWEILEAPVQLCVFGSGEGVARLLDCARALHWNTILCDKRSEMYNRMQGLNAERIYECAPGELPENLRCDMRTAAVVMTHHFADDLATVSALLRTTIPYVGVLGGKTRNQRLKDELAEELATGKFERLFAPIGLNLGAEDAAEIALSITSEIMACLNRRRPGHLRDERESIHKPFPMERRIVTTTRAALALAAY